MATGEVKQELVPGLCEECRHWEDTHAEISRHHRVGDDSLSDDDNVDDDQDGDVSDEENILLQTKRR